MQCCASTSVLWTTNRSFSTRKVKTLVSFWQPDLFVKMNNSSDIFEFFKSCHQSKQIHLQPEMVNTTVLLRQLFVWDIYYISLRIWKGRLQNHEAGFMVFMVIFRPFFGIIRSCPLPPLRYTPFRRSILRPQNVLEAYGRNLKLWLQAVLEFVNLFFCGFLG